MSATADQSQPIERDLTAIEDAIVALGRVAQADAARRGTSAKDQAEAEIFRATHSQLAALIADPINEVCYIGMEALRVHLQEILPPDEIQVIYQRAMMRLAAEVGLEVPDAQRLQ